jgi:hypothetical protein
VLWYAFIGCLVGTLVGMLPGIGPLAGVSILLPLTFGLDATKAIVMLAGIYYGSQYGGSHEQRRNQFLLDQLSLLLLEEMEHLLIPFAQRNDHPPAVLQLIDQEQAIEQRHPFAAEWASGGFLGPLRASPRWAKLAGMMNLPETG